MQGRLGFKGNLSVTAMGIMPHEDHDRALELALEMDIPFWPQLPRVSFYEVENFCITERCFFIFKVKV